MTRKALVTGAAGFIGKHVARQLLEDGWDVAGLDVQTMPAALDCEWHTASILDDDAVARAVRGCDTVFHLAAKAHLFARDSSSFDTVNHLGALRVLHAAQLAGTAHFIATLSATALTPVGHHGEINAQLLRPDLQSLAGPYAASKWRADAAMDSPDFSSIAITRLFPTAPIGAGDDAFTAPTQMVRMFLTAPPPAILDTALNLVPVQDVAKAHIQAAASLDLKRSNSQRRYILAGERWLLSDLLKYLEMKTGKAQPARTIPYGLARISASVVERAARLRGRSSLATVEGVRLASADPVFVDSSARTDLGWAPSDVQRALDKLIAWLENLDD